MSKRNIQRLLGVIILVLLALVKIKEWNQEQGQVTELANDPISSSISNSSCVQCHGEVQGMSPYHEEIGCVACHLGNNESEIEDSSHIGMISIPGNFSDADATCGICHVQALSDIKHSMMTTNSGIIAIDRFIFGESNSPDSIVHINDLGYSAADVHLRNLCTHCHLGNEKKEMGPISEKSRGGGCNACHLNYSEQALSERLHIDSFPHSFHPSLDLNVSDAHCFGCHSRSGRISTNYEGWHETLLSKDSILPSTKYRILEDDRVFEKRSADIHHEKGLACIDCHMYEDVMGDGKLHAHEEDAVKLSCEDCHFDSNPYTLSYDELNFSQRRILKMRKYLHDNSKILTTKVDTVALLNAYIDDDGNAILLRKSDQKKFTLGSPSESCSREAGHQDISCTTCHSAWAPQCLGCHSDFDPNAKGYDLFTADYMDGTWIEYAAEFLADEPAMGVRIKQGKREISPAIPGMIMTLDQSNFPNSDKKESEFHRLFAPAEPHTTSATGRTCTSCHASSAALGYGRGELIFNVKEAKWTYESAYENLQDGLPADAWIGFLREPAADMYSTRRDFKPFSVEEQKRILSVGACLSCHKDDSKILLNSLSLPFSEYKKKMSSECAEAVFN